MIFLIFLVIKFHKTSELQTQSIRKALENELLKYNCEFSSKKGIKSDQILTCSNKEYKTERNKVIVDQTIIDKLSNPTLPTNEGVLINIKNSDFEIRSSMIEKVSTIDSEAQILSFKGDGEHTISRTKFNVVLSKDKKSIKESEIFMHNCYDPSVIIFEDYSNNLIIESEFFSNTNVKENKLYENHPMRCIRTSKSINLIVDQTHFFNATSYHQGSFVKHESEGELFIKKSYFYSCLDRSNIAHGIYTNQGPINIEYCKFDNIDTKLSTQGSIILSESKLLNFIGNKIAFKNPIISNRFLFLSKRGIFNISENKFKDYENERNNAAIFIPTASKITFNYNEFSNIISDGISHGIYLVFDRMNTTKIIGNKFQNISSSDSFFYIKAENGIEINITFDNLDLNNVHQNGGGIINIENNENKTYGLILNNCIFSDNNNTDGGSLLINQKTYPFCKGLIVNNCEIVLNTASGRGGAIAFFNDGNVSIIDCFCNLNAAFGGGGVIYIETDSKDKRQFYISGSEFNRNYGDKSHCIWINVLSFDDDYTFECESCRFFDNNGHYEYNSEGGACCVSNCKRAVFTECIFSAQKTRESCGGINITAKSILEVQNCQFNRCITGSNKESYGGGICYSLHSSDELDRSRDEDISITDCAFEENEGYNGVSLFLNVTTLNIHISNIEILNHLTSDHIFCINFNEKITNDILIMNNISFIGNSHNSKVIKDFCGGSGICFSSAKELKKLIVQFVNCNFEYNRSPVNGGAFGYDMKDDQKEIDFIFDNCHFKHNLCELSGGACHFCSNNTIDIINCEFINNTSKGTKSNSGGGSIGICSSAELITIHGCKFIIKDCIFSENNAEFGGAISIESSGNYEINNCIFNNNKAELSSDGKGGSILIGNCSSCIEDDPSNKNEIIIQNSIFESNEAFHGEAIYIGQHYLTDLHIMNNKFINNFDKSLEHLNSSIIESEICYDHIYHGINKEILKNNYFSNELNGEKIFVNRFSCIDDHYVPSDEFSNSDMFTLSDEFSNSNMFTLSDEFSNSDMFTSSDEFSSSYMFTSSKTISTEISNFLSKSTKQVTFSKSYSLTYVEKKSVSYSLSYFVSNTYDISYDIIDKTYKMYITQSNYHSYFPYIIKYLSPIYIEKDVTIEIIKKKTISKENLIGIVCGSASAFFLILGIIILSVRRRNEIINQYNEFDDISSSSIENERPKANNRADVNNETNLNDDQTNVDDEIWI